VHVEQNFHLAVGGAAHVAGHGLPTVVYLNQTEVLGAVAVEGFVVGARVASGFTPRNIRKHFDW
jgi:hypothetical protein